MLLRELARTRGYSTIFKVVLSAGVILFPGLAAAKKATLYITARVPVIGHSVAIGAVRPSIPSHNGPSPLLRPANSWTKLASLPNATVHDVAFESATIGYAAAELGQVWKTKDGGNTWQLVRNRGFPYYYYG